ncbi:hypothetical protein GCM10022399_17600 [Terrabacter ginsenosidimutans]|uniref:Uncharacterized protein n=1 Tax=Terrabacter ginsenosidimutans TaxID=490575 RepID=A0ABP7DAH6_9MICO
MAQLRARLGVVIEEGREGRGVGEATRRGPWGSGTGTAGSSAPTCEKASRAAPSGGSSSSRARAEVAGAGERVVCREAALTEEGGVGQQAPELRERWDRSH